eukprot:2288042-Pleurochrysis_carterae.AAC.1
MPSARTTRRTPSTACHASTSSTRSLPFPLPASCPASTVLWSGRQLYVHSQPLACIGWGGRVLHTGRSSSLPHGDLLFCLSFHACLMETQHAHPDVMN